MFTASPTPPWRSLPSPLYRALGNNSSQISGTDLPQCATATSGQIRYSLTDYSRLISKWEEVRPSVPRLSRAKTNKSRLCLMTPCHAPPIPIQIDFWKRRRDSSESKKSIGSSCEKVEKDCFRSFCRRLIVLWKCQTSCK